MRKYLKNLFKRSIFLFLFFLPFFFDVYSIKYLEDLFAIKTVHGRHIRAKQDLTVAQYNKGIGGWEQFYFFNAKNPSSRGQAKYRDEVYIVSKAHQTYLKFDGKKVSQSKARGRANLIMLLNPKNTASSGGLGTNVAFQAIGSGLYLNEAVGLTAPIKYKKKLGDRGKFRIVSLGKRKAVAPKPTGAIKISDFLPVCFKIPGSLTQIDATGAGGSGEVVGMNKSGNTFLYVGGKKTWKALPTIPGVAKQVSIGSDKIIFGLNKAGVMYKFVNNKWVKVAGIVVQIAVGNANNICGVNAAGYLYTWNKGWKRWFRDYGVTGAKWCAIGEDGSKWYLKGTKPHRWDPNSKKWIPTTGGLKGGLNKIFVVNKNLVLGLNADNELFVAGNPIVTVANNNAGWQGIATGTYYAAITSKNIVWLLREKTAGGYKIYRGKLDISKILAPGVVPLVPGVVPLVPGVVPPVPVIGVPKPGVPTGVLPLVVKVLIKVNADLEKMKEKTYFPGEDVSELEKIVKAIVDQKKIKLNNPTQRLMAEAIYNAYDRIKDRGKTDLNLIKLLDLAVMVEPFIKVSTFKNYIKTYVIDPLKKKGVELPAIKIAPSEKLLDLLVRLRLQDIPGQVRSLKKIFEWAKLRTFKPWEIRDSYHFFDDVGWNLSRDKEKYEDIIPKFVQILEQMIKEKSPLIKGREERIKGDIIVGLAVLPKKPEGETYYQILSIPQNATVTDINNKYKKLVLKVHPDKNPSYLKKTAKEAMAFLNGTIALLRDAAKRNRYNNWLKTGEGFDPDFQVKIEPEAMSFLKDKVKEIKKPAPKPAPTIVPKPTPAPRAIVPRRRPAGPIVPYGRGRGQPPGYPSGGRRW